LAGVDYVLMGAGIPAEIPQLLDHLAVHEKCSLDLDVDDATMEYSVGLDPQALTGGALAPLRRPMFLAIVSATCWLPTWLARTLPGRTASSSRVPARVGHNAPARWTPGPG